MIVRLWVGGDGAVMLQRPIYSIVVSQLVFGFYSYVEPNPSYRRLVLFYTRTYLAVRLEW